MGGVDPRLSGDTCRAERSGIDAFASGAVAGIHRSPNSSNATLAAARSRAALRWSERAAARSDYLPRVLGILMQIAGLSYLVLPMYPD